MSELIENKKKSEILAEKISTMKYGDVITHEEIETIIREKHGTQKYGNEISRAKKLLLKKYHKYIENVRSDGYRLIHPDDFAGVSLLYTKKGLNNLQKGKETLENAPIEDMTRMGAIKHRVITDKMAMLCAAMKGASVEMKELSKSKSLLSPDSINRPLICHMY